MPKARSEDSYTTGGGGGEYGMLEEDSYVFEVTGYKNNGVIPDRFDPNGEKTITDLRYFARPIQYADDPESPLIEAKTKQPLNPDKTVQIFFKPEHVGFGPAGASKGRKFLAAALGVPLKSEINYDYDDLVGGRFIGDVEYSKDGRYDNIVDFRPVKAKRERPRPATTPVEAAKATFDLEDSDDDLPF